MKKILLVIFIILSARLTFADQLAWITKEQADKTIAFFEDEEIKEVVLWCACCDGDPKTKVKVKDIFYRKTSDPSYYEVYIAGNTYDGTPVNQPVDLAYVHIKKGGKWRCLGKELKFECDPCTKAFKL